MSEKKYNWGENVSREAREHGIGGGFFKFREGKNVIRILSESAVIASHFRGKGQKSAVCYGMDKGCPYHGAMDTTDPKSKEYQNASVKWATYVIDRADGGIKLADLPYGVVQAIGELQKSEDWAFDGAPMPYDITITATNAGTKEVEYTVIPSPKRAPITVAEEEEFAKKKPVDQVVERRKQKEQEGDDE